MGQTSIEWTDKTWSPLRAIVRRDAAEIARAKGYTSLIQIAEKMAGHIGPHCERISSGCDHCYSDTNNGRCLPSNGTGLPFDRRSRDLVEPIIDEKILAQPLKWTKPQRVFVENQSDLFGEWVADWQLDRVFAVMAHARARGHIFQVLTKRIERAAQYFSQVDIYQRWLEAVNRVRMVWPGLLATGLSDPRNIPLGNVWLGVSVENQQTADARIPLLLQTPAAVRFVSYEPALGPVDFEYPTTLYPKGPPMCCSGMECGCRGLPTEPPLFHGLDWLIVGGESGPGARPFRTEWAESVVSQCKVASVACFVKQLGAHVIQGGERRKKVDKKGGDMHEWPHEIRVRQFPEVKP